MLSSTRRRSLSTWPLVQDMLRVTSENLQDTACIDTPFHREEKAAQRGPEVFQSLLTALMTKAAVASWDCALSWIEPSDETWILEMIPWVGESTWWETQ